MKLFYCYICMLFTTVTFSQTEVWVATSGDNTADGSKEHPVQSIELAIRKARDIRRVRTTELTTDVAIILKEGTYYVDKTIKVRPEDAGTLNSVTIIKGAEGAEVFISGGTQITNWKKLHKNVQGLPKVAAKNVWVAQLPYSNGSYLNFRQLWVNNTKANRASNLDADTLDRIIAVDKVNRTFTIPNPNYNFHNLEDVEFVIHQWWAIANLKMQSIAKNGKTAKISLKEPGAQIEFEHPWPAPFIDEKNEYNGNSMFYWVGAVELLDNPGEWYADFKNGLVYYWPRKDEDLNKATVVAPVLETLLAVEGTLDTPVANVKIENITFEHVTWMRPSYKGHVPLQAGFYIEEGYKLKPEGTANKPKLDNQAWLGRQGAAVTIANANNIVVTNCVIRHVAATGVDAVAGVHNSSIIGNVFTDIGGTAIQGGFFGDASFEAHLPYNPTDERVLVANVNITNNVIHNATNEDWGCVGIGIGFAKNITIAHNDLSDLNYTGISLGWGWTKAVNCLQDNRVKANRIHRFALQMYDVAGIYTLSAQPGTVIEENAIYDLMKAPYAHMPHHHQYIYLDEGSAYMRIQHNWTERDKFFCNANGPGNEWENNGVKVSEEIKNNAGLEPQFQYLLDKLK